MSARAYCERCKWRTRHVGGVCEECSPERAPEPKDGETLDLMADLFAAPADAPAQRHSPTSVAAAEAVKPALPAKRRDLLAYICERYPQGVTDNRLIEDLVKQGWSPNGVRPRRTELVQGGWLDADGTLGGSTVWAPTPQAMAWHRRQGRAA